MPPVIIKLDNYYSGDSWEGMLVGPVVINEVTPTSPVTAVRMQFRDSEFGDLGYELNTDPAAGEGLITITDADTWEINIPAQVIGLVAGRWDWDLECTDSTGYVVTLYRGVLTVKGDITRDN